MPADSARVCAVITEETVEAARAAIEKAARLADLIELRLDYLRDFDFTRPGRLAALLDPKPLPAIITCRALDEGGKQHVDEEIRLRLLVEGARGAADYCDVEASRYERAARLSPDLSRLLVSYHNFEETPADLRHVYDRVCALPAAVHKIVTKAASISDALAIFRLLDRARGEGRNLIALAMGEPGLITRVLGPAAGCFLTYAALEGGRESAPAQPDCREMTAQYRVHQISPGTTVMGIVGSPIAHTASPAIHNAALGALGLDAVYLPIKVENLAEFFTRFVRPATREMTWGLRGLSVTIPHKSAVIPLLDEIDPRAAKVGAVNTLVIDGETVKGYNTDVGGAVAPLESACVLEGARCAVVGAGGAARAVVYGLAERGADIEVFARDTEKARGLADQFGVRLLPLDALAASRAEVIINTTPVGMRGHSEGSSPVPRAAFRNCRIAYDLVYNPMETQFLIDARSEGCRTIGGLEMLIAQAALQFELWTGRPAPLDVMSRAALERLSRPQA
jgi:3-dehydroquinate dehydratase/shikimate dehydrogenase